MDMNLASNLKKQAQDRSEAVAIVHGDRKMTYSELWNMTKAIMFHMLGQGFQKGDRVSILLKNTPEYVAAYYAVLALGGIAVPLNTATKYRDLSNWLMHSGSAWLVASSDHSELSKILLSYKGKVLLDCIEGSPDFDVKAPCINDIIKSYIGGYRDIEIITEQENNSPAAIIYTSGTTGQPKGVTLSHGNLFHNTKSIIEYLGLKATDCIVNVLPFYYSYGNSILHSHIAVGATIVLANNMLFPKLILELIEKEKATGFSGVPATYALLLNRVKISDYNLSSLRYMTQAGGPMPPANITRLLDCVKEIEFYVMYGQTEATARLSYLPPSMLHKKIGSIGTAIPGVELEIRDKKGRRVIGDAVGEIYARGKNIMIGYWNDKERTKSVIKKGWLKTGDLAHYDEDGYIYIVGRSSEMIKTGANRVSPKDIEEVIVAIDGVEEVAAIGIPDKMLGQVIKVFIVKQNSIDIDEKVIMAYCKENLATYKLPKKIEFVTSIPKTASGKVQRFMLH